MILVTVGTQLPFPRLISHMQSLGLHGTEQIIAQTGEDTLYPGLTTHRVLSASDFRMFAQDARLIIGHAGIGTVLAARNAGRPLIVVPRRAALGEHRNDHQMATAMELEGKHGIRVAWDVNDIDRHLSAHIEVQDGSPSQSYAGLLDTIRAFVAA